MIDSRAGWVSGDILSNEIRLVTRGPSAGERINHGPLGDSIRLSNGEIGWQNVPPSERAVKSAAAFLTLLLILINDLLQHMAENTWLKEYIKNLSPSHRRLGIRICNGDVSVSHAIKSEKRGERAAWLPGQAEIDRANDECQRRED